jgi:hypothetical protein
LVRLFCKALRGASVKGGEQVRALFCAQENLDHKHPPHRILVTRHLFSFLVVAPALLAIDNDHDGMDDLWQLRHNIAPFTGSENPDKDARINLVESRNMSSPHQADSHLGIVIIRDISPQDGLPDVWQAKFGIPAAQKFDDPDGDLRTNIEEALLLSNPLVADVPFTLLGSRPPEVERPGPDSFIARMADSAPGRRYRLEVSDTLLPDSWTTASLVGGGSPYQWGTGDEISAVAMTGAAPRKFFRWVIDDPDSDGDFLPDFLEMQIGSNPGLADTDGDGFADGEEYQQTADPLSAGNLPGVGGIWDVRDGTEPVVWLRTAYKRVDNSWGKDVQLPPTPIVYGASVKWSDFDSPEQQDDYGTYIPKWEEKWDTLTFPPSLSAGVNFDSGRVETLARQHLALEHYQITVQQSLFVAQVQPHYGQFQPPCREIGIGQASRRQRLHPSLFQPGQIGPMPHHSGVIGVLRQHTPYQGPGVGLLMLHHGVRFESQGAR